MWHLKYRIHQRKVPHLETFTKKAHFCSLKSTIKINIWIKNLIKAGRNPKCDFKNLKQQSLIHYYSYTTVQSINDDRYPKRVTYKSKLFFHNNNYCTQYTMTGRDVLQ